jgi:hypothetical protein
MLGKMLGKIVGEVVALPVTVAGEIVEGAETAIDQAGKAIDRGAAKFDGEDRLPQRRKRDA